MTPAVELQGLCKRFEGFQLGPLDLTVEPGTVLALIGPNGAGKTTALNCMAGLLLPDEGQARILGHRVHPTELAYRRHLGYVGEQAGFYRRWTAARNLDALAQLIPGWSRERANQLAGRFALPLGRAFDKMSRGNQTKLALVAAMAHSPQLLLLDEPTAGLDPVIRSELLDVLWEMAEDGEHAVVYSTHVLSDISRLADELAFLRDGQPVLRTRVDDLTEGWRRISFRLAQEVGELAHVVQHRTVRSEHQIVTSNADATLEQLRELHAEAIETARMTVDEIAVQILKEGHHVVSNQD